MSECPFSLRDRETCSITHEKCCEENWIDCSYVKGMQKPFESRRKIVTTRQKLSDGSFGKFYQINLPKEWVLKEGLVDDQEVRILYDGIVRVIPVREKTEKVEK